MSDKYLLDRGTRITMQITAGLWFLVAVVLIGGSVWRLLQDYGVIH